jgi:hypothetical protein
MSLHLFNSFCIFASMVYEQIEPTYSRRRRSELSNSVCNLHSSGPSALPTRPLYRAPVWFDFGAGTAGYRPEPLVEGGNERLLFSRRPLDTPELESRGGELRLLVGTARNCTSLFHRL